MFTFSLRGSVRHAPSIEAASALYASLRDRSGEGASTFPTGVLRDADGDVVGYISYNAKVWATATGAALDDNTDDETVRTFIHRSMDELGLTRERAPLFNPYEARA